MAYFKLVIVLYSFLLSLTVMAAEPKPLPNLPLWNASNVVSGDSLIFVNSGQSNLAHRLYLYDLVNLPPFSSSSYVLGKSLTGFDPEVGTVTDADTVLTAFNKIYANLSAIGGAPITIGAINSQTPSSNGLLLDSNILYTQYASATHPGMMSTGAQTIAGAKTFSNGITASLTGVASGNELPLTFSGPLSRATDTISIPKADTSTDGYLDQDDWDTFNKKQDAGDYIEELTGDVTASGPGSVAATIANSAVSNSKMADMAEDRIKGRAVGAGTGAPQDLTPSEVTAILNNVVGDSGSGGTKGLVPAPASGDAAAAKFLSADGTWAVPAGGDNLPDQTGNSGKFLTTDGTDPSWASVASGAWGSITGTLSDQTDLQNALNAKAPLDSPSFTGTVTLDTGLNGLLKAASGVVSAATAGTDYEAPLPVGENGLGLELDAGAKAWKAQAPRNNWLVNESFEYTTPSASWSLSGGASVTASTSVKVMGKQSIQLDNGTVVSVAQYVTPPVDFAGQNVVHSIWINTTDSGVGACSIRAGVTFECKDAIPDGKWHQYSFAYKDPGTGTRGISAYRINNGTGNTYVDAASVGYFEPNFPATINVGASGMGSILWPGEASCSFVLNSTSGSFLPFSANASCNPVAAQGSAITTYPTKTIGFTIPNATAGVDYEIETRGVLNAAAGVSCSYRYSDGTDTSHASVLEAVSGGINIPSVSHRIRFSTGGKKDVQLQVRASGTNCGVYATTSPNQVLEISVKKLQSESSLAGAIITDEPVELLSKNTLTRVTGADPTKIGEYRSMVRAASTFNYSDDAPLVTPGAANGFPLYRGNTWTSNDSPGNPTLWKFFVGKGLPIEPGIATYSGAGRTGTFDINPKSYSTNDVGYQKMYDPATGILTVVRTVSTSSATNHYIGFKPDSDVETSNPGYFDVILWKNPLAAGMKTATDQAVLDTYAGFGSTATKVYRFTNTNVKGDAISLTQDSTNGAVLTINKDGIYYGNFVCESPVNGTSDIGMTLNGDSVTTTNITSVTNAEVRIGFASSGQAGSGDTVNPNATFSRFLSRGDKVRFQGRGNTPATSANCVATLTKQPSPFEIAGMPGGGNVRSDTNGQERIERATVNCDSGSAVVSQSGTWISSVGNVSSGQCAITFSSAWPNTNYACTVSGNPGNTHYSIAIISKSTSGFTIEGKYNNGSSLTSYDADLICMGPR